MAAHEKLVHAVVRKQVLGDLPFAEALQAGRIGLWHAILGFDPQRGTAFSTYVGERFVRLIHPSAAGVLGVLGGELLTRFIPETILRKLAAVLFVGMGLLMWFDKL
jgi:hypothetical protein